ncbi:MAG: flagellar hook-associated protein FlgK [Cellvibrio sp.]
MSNISQIAYSGLNTNQVSLTTTSQNIANVNTPGFSRLSVNTKALAGVSGLHAGAGVQVTSIRRIADSFLTQQVWRATTEREHYAANQQYLTAIESLMSGDGASISSGLDQFFAAISEASATPNSIALRQQVINEAGNLAQRFNGLTSSIQSQMNALHEQRIAMSQEINGLTENIALLNKKILETKSVNGDTSTLEDERDTLIGQLAKFAQVRTTNGPHGVLNISLANGQPLVDGSTAARLTVDETATGEQKVMLHFAHTDYPLAQDSFGGAFGGLYKAEFETMRPTQKALEEMAQQISSLVNQALAQGYDLNGNAGAPLFSFNPGSTSQLLEVNNLSASDLAFSSAPNESGNNEALLEVFKLRNETITVAGNQITLNDAYAVILGDIASISRQNQADLDTATTVQEQAQSQRNSVSAVNLDEEYINLMNYQQAYQANMKVISTVNNLFDQMIAML